MNKTTLDIYMLLLQDRAEVFDKERLKVSHLHTAYVGIREARFYDQIFFPRYLRAMQMIKEWGIFDGQTEWDVQSFGYLTERIGVYPLDTEVCDYIAWRFCEAKESDSYFAKFWDSEDWFYEEPTEQEIRDLYDQLHKGEIIKLVQDVVTAYGTQKSLF